MPTPSPWTCALQLAPDRTVTGGSYAALATAIRQAADLRIYTEFRHEEHIAPFKPGAPREPENEGLIREVIDFRETFLLDDCHVAGVTLLRQPLEPTWGFNGTQPRLAFFLYNMDGQQACANLMLDDLAPTGEVGSCEVSPTPDNMPKLSPTVSFDVGTLAPSRNFIYDMEVYRFWVRDDWEEVLAHDEAGQVTGGCFADLETAQAQGREIKVGLRDLCADLGAGPGHEVFTHLGSSFVHTARRTFEVLSHPLVRLAPAIPLVYGSGRWDVSWVFLRTDGFAVRRTLNPYTRTFSDHELRLACRWFVR
jgi:hypothetical protein